MDLIFNEQSFHKQFPDLSSFREAMGRVMQLRQLARQFGVDLHCTRELFNIPVTHDLTFATAIGRLNKEESRAIMQWVMHHGPFWDDDRRHDRGDWFECGGEIVTDYGLGEAAYRLAQEISCSVLSVAPSAWTTTPLEVNWIEGHHTTNIDVRNDWEATSLKGWLSSVPASLKSWSELEAAAQQRCPNLTFSADSFQPLSGVPFNRGAAEHLLSRLAILEELKTSIGPEGRRTVRGHEIYQKHFTGDKAWFSDSSDTEKATFQSDLLFSHPDEPGVLLFCTWHGKIKTPQLRFHFSWPVGPNESLYVVYVGPKITKT